MRKGARALIDFIEMFCGIGGFRAGLQKASREFNCVWANDNDKYACKIYRKHFGNRELAEKDIRTVSPKSLPSFTFLTAGFPCQAFSSAGKRQGFKDTRGTLFYEICRIVKAKQPTLLLLENVKGLLSNRDGTTFQIILRSLEELGYLCEWQVLNSKYFSVPQNRERVFIIGHFRGKGTSQIFPIGKSVSMAQKEGRAATVTQTLRANYFKHQAPFIQVAKDSGSELARVYDSRGIAPALHRKSGGWHEPKIISNAVRSGGRGSLGRHSWDAVVVADRTRTKRGKGRRLEGEKSEANALSSQVKDNLLMFNLQNAERTGEWGDGLRNDGLSYPLTGKSGKDYGVAILNHYPRTNNPKLGGSGPLISKEYCFSVDTAPHSVIADARIRRLTPTECERLQSFPDGWTIGVSETQRYKLLGNAVTVNVIEYLGGKILECLQKRNSSIRQN